jgi:hypothetical protein
MLFRCSKRQPNEDNARGADEDGQPQEGNPTAAFDRPEQTHVPKCADDRWELKMKNNYLITYFPIKSLLIYLFMSKSNQFFQCNLFDGILVTIYFF